MKPTMLLDLSTSFKKTIARKPSKVIMGKAIWLSICWIQMVTKVAFVDWVNHFINTYSMETTKVEVEGIEVDTSTLTIGKHLKFPIIEIMEEQLLVIKQKTKNKNEVIFEVDHLKETRMWKINNARQHWRL